MSDNLNINVALAIKTCPCGTVYAVPNWITQYACPTCSSRRLSEKENDLCVSLDEQARLSRRIVSLQGVITKMKQGKEKAQ